MNRNNLVVMILGSKSDLSWGKKITEHLKQFNIEYNIRIASAHKSAVYALEIINSYNNSNKNIVFIAIAGRSNALGGFLDANTHFPVINCPPPSDKYAGLDIISSFRMPSGVAPATVLEADQVALLTAKIFALQDNNLKEKIIIFHKNIKENIEKDDQDLKK